MKQLLLLPFALCMLAGSAWSATLDERVASLNAQLKNNPSYNACLAREFARVASDEKSQHDTDVAQAFMALAEEYAQKAGAAK